MKKILILFFIFCSSSLFAQYIKSWQNYSNMKQINDISTRNGTIWAATNGGVFSFSETDSSYYLLTKSEGLSSHTNTAIAIDADDKIWIGTTEGFINVYKPSTNEMSTIYDIIKVNASIKRINDIQIRNDTAFVSTSLALILISTRDLHIFDSITKFGTFPTGTPVKNVLISDNIYVVTQAGIAAKKESYDNLSAPEAWNNIDFDSGNTISKIAKFNNDIYAATNKGIFRYKNGTWSLEYLNNSLVSNIFVYNQKLYSIVEEYDKDKLLRSLLYKHSNTDEILLTLDFAPLTNINFLSDNKIILSSYLGIISIIGENKEFIFPNTPETNSLLDLAIDSDGNMWSATGKDEFGIGVLKFNGNTWETVNRENNSVFKFNDFHKVYASDNAVYFSSWGKGFIRLKNDIYEIFDAENTELVGVPNSNSFLVINDIVEDINGNAWILNYWAADRKPISVLTTDGKIFNYQFSSPLTPKVVDVEYLVIDQYNTKWFAGDYDGDVKTNGLYYFNENGTFENSDDDIWGKVTKSNGLRNNNINALAIDHFGELIIGTITGVDVIPNPSSPTSIRGDQYFSVRQQTINCISIDPLNQKWFGTEKGVFLTSPDGSSLLANYNESNSPLPADNIKSIAINEKSGIVYVGTDYGVTAISTLFIEPNEDFSNISVYPNPITLSSSTNLNLIIDGLVSDSEIKILDISGKLINEFRSIGGKTTFWNCRNFDGKLISSGIYIVVAYDSEANKIGHAKIAVLRK